MVDLRDFPKDDSFDFRSELSTGLAGARLETLAKDGGGRRKTGQVSDPAGVGDVTLSATASKRESVAAEAAGSALEAGPVRKPDPAAVDDCISKLVMLDGRDLRTDVERGRVLMTLETSCEDGAEFAEVVKRRARMTDRQARNLMGVSERFGAEVDRWAAIGVTSTHLRHLVKKSAEFIEECYADFVKNGIPTTADFALKVKGATEEKTGSPVSLRRERVAFLKALARQAAEDNLAAFLPPLEKLAEVLVAGLKKNRDGSVSVRKAELAKAAAMPARTACRILEGFLTHLVPQQGFNGLQFFDRVTVPSAELQALRIVLLQLSSIEMWPKHIGGEWIADTVLPMVQWAIGGESEVAPPVDAILIDAARAPLLNRTMPQDAVVQRLAQAGAHSAPTDGASVADNDDDADADEHDAAEPAAA